MFMFLFRLESCPMPVVFESSGPIREMFESFAPQVTVNCLHARARNFYQTFTTQVKQRDYHVELNLLFVI